MKVIAGIFVLADYVPRAVHAEYVSLNRTGNIQLGVCSLPECGQYHREKHRQCENQPEYGFQSTPPTFGTQLWGVDDKKNKRLPAHGPESLALGDSKLHGEASEPRPIFVCPDHLADCLFCTK